jgi:WD40 repeat protein
LVSRRLIRVNRIGDVDHIELTHDLLTEAIRQSRDERRKRELDETNQRLEGTRKALVRARVTVAIFIVLLIASIALIVINQQRETRRYRRLAAQNDVKVAASLAEEGRTKEALSHLANALRRDANNASARRLVVGLLLDRRWPRAAQSMTFDGAVSAVRSTDGQRFAVRSSTTISILDAATGQKLRAIPGGGIHAIALVGANDLLAAGTDDGRLLLWDTKSGSLRGEWIAHGTWVRTIALSPDGTRIASGANDRLVHLIDVETGEAYSQQVRGMVFDLEFDRSGTRLVTASQVDDDPLTDNEEDAEGGAEAIVWDAKRLTRTLPRPMLHRDAIWSVRFNHDGTRVVTASSDKTAQIWSTETGGALGPPLSHLEKVNDAEFSPDGEYLATVSEDQTARLWYVKWIESVRAAPLAHVLQHTNAVLAARFSPDGSLLVTASADGSVRGWHTDGRVLFERIEHNGPVSDVMFTNGAAPIASLSGETLRYWRFEGAIAETWPLNGSVAGVANEQIYTIDDKQLRRFSVASTRSLTTNLNSDCGTATVSPNGKFVACEGGRTFRVLRTDTGQPVGPVVKETEGIQGKLNAVFTRDSRFVLAEVPAADADPDDRSHPDDVVAIDPFRGTMIGAAMRHEDMIYGRSFDATGLRFVTASSDGFVRVWEWRSGKLLHRSGRAATRANDIVSHAAFDPSGTRVVYTSWDHTATVWTVANDKKIVLNHGNAVTYGSFSPDGKLVLTASWDLTARLWDSETGVPVGEPMRHVAEVEYAAFSPDGTMVVTIDENSNARTWDAQTGTPLNRSFRHERIGVAPTFLRSGEALVTWRFHEVRMLPLPRTESEDASPLADLAEAIGGWKMNDQGVLERCKDREVLLERIANDKRGTSVPAQIARWFAADPKKRSISPFSTTSAAALSRSAAESQSAPLRADATILLPWMFKPAEPKRTP